MQDWVAQNASFEEQALPHTGSLLRAAVRLTGTVAEAEDLVQETLLAAWRNFHQFSPGTDCKAWLFRIMLNLLTRIRRRQRAMFTLPLPEVPPPVSRGDRFASQDIESALSSLPEEQRTVLMLAAVEGFSCKEIAEITSSPIGTVMSRLARARTAVKTRLLPLLARPGAKKRANGL